MKKLLSKITALCLTMASTTCMFSYAEFDEDGFPLVEPVDMLTFNEYMEMTDDEFIDYFDNANYLRASDLTLSDIGFGDDTIEDAQKFETYFKDESSYGAPECIKFELWKDYVSGKINGCVKVNIDENIPIDYKLNAGDFGFGKDWGFEALECPGVIEMYSDDKGNVTVVYGRDFHEYRIYPPVEVYKDFETFVRFDYAVRFGYGIFNEQGVHSFDTFFERNTSGGGSMPLRFGDANIDGKVTIADSTAILQYLGNADKYPLTETALRNADCYNTGDGITGMDAVALQMIDAKIVDALPVAKY